MVSIFGDTLRLLPKRNFTPLEKIVIERAFHDIENEYQFDAFERALMQLDKIEEATKDRDRLMSGWIAPLVDAGAVTWSGDSTRPYVWHWKINMLSELYKHLAFTWAKLESFFYQKKTDGKLKAVSDIRRYHGPSWEHPVAMKISDESDGVTINLPEILSKIKKNLP